MKGQILLVEDEPKITRVVRLYLEAGGYEVSEVADGQMALGAFRDLRPDLVVLDLNLPGMDGIDVCRAMRRESPVPIIILTARGDEEDRLLGLELGADDYIVKPFSPRELVARVKAVLRRTGDNVSPSGLCEVGDLCIDPAAHRAWIGDDLLDLTPSEFGILRRLAAHPGHVLTRIQLLEETQGEVFEGYERTIDQHIKNLRQKLEAGGRARIIHTVHGVGYRLEVGEGDA